MLNIISTIFDTIDEENEYAHIPLSKDPVEGCRQIKFLYEVVLHDWKKSVEKPIEESLDDPSIESLKQLRLNLKNDIQTFCAPEPDWDSKMMDEVKTIQRMEREMIESTHSKLMSDSKLMSEEQVEEDFNKFVGNTENMINKINKKNIILLIISILVAIICMIHFMPESKLNDLIKKIDLLVEHELDQDHFDHFTSKIKRVLRKLVLRFVRRILKIALEVKHTIENIQRIFSNAISNDESIKLIWVLWFYFLFLLFLAGMGKGMSFSEFLKHFSDWLLNSELSKKITYKIYKITYLIDRLLNLILNLKGKLFDPIRALCSDFLKSNKDFLNLLNLRKKFPRIKVGFSKIRKVGLFCKNNILQKRKVVTLFKRINFFKKINFKKIKQPISHVFDKVRNLKVFNKLKNVKKMELQNLPENLPENIYNEKFFIPLPPLPLVVVGLGLGIKIFVNLYPELIVDPDSDLLDDYLREMKNGSELFIFMNEIDEKLVDVLD